MYAAPSEAVRQIAGKSSYRNALGPINDKCSTQLEEHKHTIDATFPNFNS